MIAMMLGLHQNIKKWRRALRNVLQVAAICVAQSRQTSGSVATKVHLNEINLICAAAPLLVDGMVTGVYIGSRKLPVNGVIKNSCTAPTVYLDTWINLAGDSSRQLCLKKS